MLQPPSYVGHRQALHEAGKSAVVVRPEDQMPVVGHQTVRQDPDRLRLEDVVEGTDERCEVGRIVKHILPADTAVEDVIDHSPEAMRACRGMKGETISGLAFGRIIGPVPPPSRFGPRSAPSPEMNIVTTIAYLLKDGSKKVVKSMGVVGASPRRLITTCIKTVSGPLFKQL